MLDKIHCALKRCLRVFDDWISYESSFMQVLVFGGFSAITFVLVLAYSCRFSPEFQDVSLYYLIKVMSVLAGVAGVSIIYHVYRHYKTHFWL